MAVQSEAAEGVSVSLLYELAPPQAGLTDAMPSACKLHPEPHAGTGLFQS